MCRGVNDRFSMAIFSKSEFVGEPGLGCKKRQSRRFPEQAGDVCEAALIALEEKLLCPFNGQKD